MPDRPRKSKKPGARPDAPESRQIRASQFSGQRRHDMATRSTLSRLRNRKSDLK